MVGAIRSWSCWKAVGRSFWGRWASGGNVECITYDDRDEPRTSRLLNDPTRNPVWAAIITSRIRMRLWEIAWEMPIARVFVDSVVIKKPIEESDAIGGWKLVEYFPKGGYVGITGVSQ